MVTSVKKIFVKQQRSSFKYREQIYIGLGNFLIICTLFNHTNYFKQHIVHCSTNIHKMHQVVALIQKQFNWNEN